MKTYKDFVMANFVSAL